MVLQERAGGSNRGFTLIELLVVIAIIGVLVAILLPAVQQARETSRRTQCGNNLRQIGVALFSYDSSNSSFPFGALEQRGVGPSWQVALMPFLEQASFYDKFAMVGPNPGNPTFPLSPNAALLNGKTVPSLLCSSSPVPSIFIFGTVRVPMSSYAGISGATNDLMFPAKRVTACCQPNSNDGQVSGDGVLIPNNIVRIADITDGTSNVLMVGEASNIALTTSGAKRIDASYSIGFAAGTSALGSPPSLVAPTSGAMPPPVYNLLTIRYAPNTSFFQPGTTTIRPGMREAMGPNNPLSSPHTGGAQALRADGGVIFLSENIDIDILKRAACRDDGAPVGEL